MTLIYFTIKIGLNKKTDEGEKDFLFHRKRTLTMAFVVLDFQLSLEGRDGRNEAVQNSLQQTIIKLLFISCDGPAE